MGGYAPAILTADPPSVSGGDYFGVAMGFLADMRWTGFVSTYGGYSESTDGGTASTDAAGLPIAGLCRVGVVAARRRLRVAVSVDGGRRVSGRLALAPERRRPHAAHDRVERHGDAGDNGWYVSDVSVTWDVQDADSAVTSQTGCDPGTVAADTAGTTFTCEATSDRGDGDLVDRRAEGHHRADGDVLVAAVVPDLPGRSLVTGVGHGCDLRAASPTAMGATSTSTPGSFLSTVTGTDRAGNRTTRVCAYTVVIPTCNGLTATRVGTALNDVINGTSGRDVIVGLGGADTINGNGGDDVICGLDGPDTVDGGAGNDWIDGGASPDDLSGGSGDDFLDGGPHNDSLRGDNGRDTCVSGEVRRSSCEL